VVMCPYIYSFRPYLDEPLSTFPYSWDISSTVLRVHIGNED